jgi:hypothetical protein
MVQEIRAFLGSYTLFNSKGQIKLIKTLKWFNKSQEVALGYIYLALCPQWAYLSVFIGYIADESGSEYLI